MYIGYNVITEYKTNVIVSHKDTLYHIIPKAKSFQVGVLNLKGLERRLPNRSPLLEQLLS